jgi:F-type H+-transporting ATPase subunit b
MLESLGITKDLIADLIINIGSIIVLFVIVKKLAYKPVKKFMYERTERVMAQKAEAEALMAQAEEKEEKYNSLLAECESAKAEAIKEGEKQAHKESEEIISDAKIKAEDIVSKAKAKAQEKYDRAVEEANDYIVNLTIDASSMLLKREINDDDNKKIVEEFLNSVDGDKNA